jgi:CubicO group peptidase (beta-lactamase class C family)
MKKTAGKLAAWVVSLAALLVVAVFTLTLVIRYPNPVAALQLAQSVPSEQPELMATHLIPQSVLPHEWETGEQISLPESFEFKGQTFNTADLLRATATNALLVIKDGKLVYEDYAQGFSPNQLTNTMSIGKTVVSMAVGILISEGKIREQEPITTYLPQFAEVPDLDEVTIQHLLDMQSCIGIDDDYPSGPAGWGFPIAQLFATTDVEFVLANNLKVVCSPGSEEYVYRSVNTQLLGMAVSAVAGMSLSDFVGANIWQRIGASEAASWAVDKEGGTEKAYCCFNATARDLGLLGGVFLNQGKVAWGPTQDQQVLPTDWFARMTTPAKKWFGGYGSERFGANMWHRPNGALITQGYRGQFMLINQQTNTIVIKLSDDVENKFYDQVLALIDQLGEG